MRIKVIAMVSVAALMLLGRIVFDEALTVTTPVLQDEIAQDHCKASTPMHLNGQELSLEHEEALWQNDMIYFQVCEAGVLSLVMRGSQVDQLGPHVVIAFGLERLWEGEITDLVEVTLDVPHAGWIGVAFVNDAYQPPEDRNLYIAKLSFESTSAVTDQGFP